MRYRIFVVIVFCFCILALMLARYDSSLRAASTGVSGPAIRADYLGLTVAQLQMKVSELERRVAELERANRPRFEPVR